ncbi:hypothetical protein ABZ651_34100, partial [Streptomyces sp. NPDC007070]
MAEPLLPEAASHQPIPPAPRPCALLLSGAQVVTVYTDGSVAVDGDRIVDVGPAPEVEARRRARRRIDCRGRAVLPGFTDAHTQRTRCGPGGGTSGRTANPVRAGRRDVGMHGEPGAGPGGGTSGRPGVR